MTIKLHTCVHVRWMIRVDLPSVLRIEQQSFDTPWTEEDFLRVLRQRNCIGLVAEYGERPIAFAIYEMQKKTLRILNFAVDPQYRRSGVGTQMVDKLINKLSSHRRAMLALVVREENLPAQLFFRAQGFKAVRVLRSYYEGSQDAYLMEYRL